MRVPLPFAIDGVPQASLARDAGFAMWKGLKKALGHRAKAQKTGPSDVSIRSTSSAGQSSHGALFALDVAEDAMVTASDSQDEQQHQQQPVASAALTWALLQQQRQQQHAVQQLVQQAEDSTSKRRAAAMQKRVNNSMLNPSTCLYQISSLLSLSTLFEHKVSSPNWCSFSSPASPGSQQCTCSYIEISSIDVANQQSCIHAAYVSHQLTSRRLAGSTA